MSDDKPQSPGPQVPRSWSYSLKKDAPPGPLLQDFRASSWM
jgi:hypothetical protein